MENELYNAFNSIAIEKLSEDDKKELLRLFEASKIRFVYTEIAFILSALNYDEAIPIILKKISDKEFYEKNGSLVYALESMDVVNYLDSFVRIVCEQGYLARMQALRIINKIAPLTSALQRRESLQILNDTQRKIESLENSREIESRIKFILRAKEIINENV